MTCALLVPWRYKLNFVANLVERIQHADVAVAADTKDIRYLLLDQIFCDEFATLHFGLAVLSVLLS